MGIKLVITEGEKQTRMPRAYSIPALQGQITVHENNILTLMEAVASEKSKIESMAKLITGIRQAEVN